LEVLDEIDRICRKYNIKYFADWGTLLGAVRHGGFIPWDDDLDICMKRSDYKKFLQAADKELKGDFKIFTYETHPDFWHFMARVVGKPHICFEKEHLKKFHEFPYITGVDIFVLDYVSSDRAKEEQRDMAARYVIEAADEICTQNLSKEKIDSYLRKIEMLCSVKIPEELKKIDNSFDRNNAVLNVQVSMRQRKHDLRVYLYRLAENLFDLFDEKQSDSLTRMMPNGLYDNNLRFSKEYYDEMLWLPFENTNIPVPFAYDEMLRERYGDYMNIVKNTGGHDYPFFEAQQKQLDKVLESEPDIALPKFTFTKELLVRAETVKQNSCKSMAAECQLEFNRLNLKLKDSVSKEDFENVLEILEISQQLAIDLGTMIENCKGEGYRTVQLLQEYCENIFSLYEAVTQGGDIDKNLSNMLTSLEDVGESIEKDIIKRKEAVFITYKASQWDYISSVWKAAMEDEDCDVYVIVVPYYYKDFDGTIRDMQYEAEQYPVDVKITKYDEFNFELHCPDIIFIQNACDKYNPSVTIHTFFYSDNLKKFTDKLVYIPPFEIDEFTKKNYCEYLNMKYYCTVPGVINADKVFVQSENMRDLYIEKLVEFAGEDTRKVWEEKILGFGLPRFDIVKGNSEDYVKLTEEWEQIIQKPDGGRKKVILYSTSVSELLKYGSEVLKKYKRVFETFKENMDDVVLLWHPDSLISLGVSSLDSQIWEEYNNLVEQFKTEHYGIYDDSTDMNYAISISDAYYGNVNSEVWLCKKAGLNIMIDESINLDLESEKIFCSFEELYDDGEYYWFTSWNYNALFRMDRESWSVEYIGSFPDEAPNGFRLYSSILEYNGRLYFTPCRANE
ncbi:MAG: LicD family protein, partial [Lachnospiraceae bacterium]|nr:LicD family protein [Lachnospiraceae bacterium]